jgi:dephospho-CoA kinase
MVKEVEKSAGRVAVIVIPLLFEARVPIYYDEAWLVYCPESVQLERLITRDRFSEEEARKRIESQIPIDEKVKMCDVVIDSSGDFKNTRRQIEAEWEKLIERIKHRIV